MKKFLIIFLLFAAPIYAQESVVAEIRNKYPTPPGPANTVLMLKEIAKEINHNAGTNQYGILRKTNGENCGGYACDIICIPDVAQYDIFVASDSGNGPSLATWQNIPAEKINWQQGCEIIPYTGSPTEPPTTPPNNDLTLLLARIYEGQQKELELLNKIVVLLEYQVKSQEAITGNFEEFRNELKKLRGNWTKYIPVLGAVIMPVLQAIGLGK